MAKGKLDSIRDKNTTCSTDLSFLPEDDLFELVWENGQILKQDGKVWGNGLLDEIPMSVPSDEMDLSQDDDMMPWLNYPIDESLQHEYCSDFLPELSGVSSVVGGEATRPRNSSFPLYPSSSQQFQTSLPSLRSRVSDITGNNMSSAMHHAVCGDSTRVASAAGGFPTIKMQKKDPMPPSSNSNLMNFSHFSRPAALVKANLENIGLMAASGLSSMERMASKEKGSAASSENPPESTPVTSSSGLRRESSSHCQPVAVPLKLLDFYVLLRRVEIYLREFVLPEGLVKVRFVCCS
ncbi:hypothetical protein FH972_011945 [Carpinus fangiana]|uniref:Uncharacterized protein n=1 Tax=Carpinus fangiana TaxID=176857 RepID=A0A5N6R2B2_9ROSI|nr:hypothetical protein FH972_011945 [Carpinus fangiana]